MAQTSQATRDEFIEKMPRTKEFLLGLPIRGYGKFYKNPCLREVKKRFDIADSEARLLYVLAVLFMKHEKTLPFSMLSSELGLLTKEQLQVLDIVNRLIARKLLLQSNRQRHHDPFNPPFDVNEQVASFILFGRDQTSDCDMANMYAVISAAANIFKGHEPDEDPPEAFTREMEQLIRRVPDTNLLFPYLKRTCPYEAIVFLLAAERKLNGNDTLPLQDICKALYGDNLAERARFLRRIMKKELVLLQEKVLVLDERQRSAFRSTTSILLSDTVARKLFFDDTEEAPEEKRRYFSSSVLEFLSVDSFHEKILLDGRLADEIGTVCDAVTTKGFARIRKELKDLKMPQGLTILFHGSPGTGKTASVHEIAKRCDRDVLQVSVSQIRDMWVGESEKNTKKIFSEYARAREELPVEPILLINEADALLNRRMQTSRSVDMMNNAMQNILLEELEKFQGILFATTNLIENMDDAFSRRFLYKLEFPKPSEAIRKAIWRAKLPRLDEETAEVLAEFELSGGQIENVARRVLIGRLFRPKEGVTELLELCKEEIGFKQKNGKGRVGFRGAFLNEEG
ncbi:MAG TPA: ATP-binding protein [bacterium]|nr:ATP-binding protein [bacterium]